MWANQNWIVLHIGLGMRNSFDFAPKYEGLDWAHQECGPGEGSQKSEGYSILVHKSLHVHYD